MNKNIYAVICLLANISLSHAMNPPMELTQSTQFTQSMHTHEKFEAFDNTLNPSDRRNLRAADRSIWKQTPMPKELQRCGTKEQTNCVFLSAAYYSPTTPAKSNLVMKWLLDYREDRQFSCYLKKDYTEYHVNPQFIAKNNEDEKTLRLLQHHGFIQKKIKEGTFYFPSPLLWGCISGNPQLAADSLLKHTEVRELIKESPEEILDCMYISKQNNNLSDINIAEMLLMHEGIKEIYTNSLSSDTHSITTDAKLPISRKKRSKSTTQKIKNKIKKYI